MAEYTVDTVQLNQCAAQIAALQRELDAVAVKLGAMQLGSILQIKASTALLGRVGDCKWAAAHQSDDLGRLARGLEDIASLYDNNEKNLSEPKTETPPDPNNNPNIPDWLEGVFDFADDIGFPFWDYIGTLVDAGFGSDAGTIFGTFFAFLESGFQNFEEFNGDWSNPMMWAEFFTEGAIDALIGIAAGAAFVALFNPATIGATIAVGVVAVTVVWAANAVSEAIFGKDISEAIVDGAQWLGEYLANNDVSIGEQISTKPLWL